MRYVGIDYSLSSPSICIYEEKGGSFFEDCRFFFLTDLKKCHVKSNKYDGRPHKEWKCDEERYWNITNWVLSVIEPNDTILLEGYSMASTGRVFAIAENAGLLKFHLWTRKNPVVIFPPTVIKKFASGSGRADKKILEEFFIKETGEDIRALLDLTPKQENPISDIIDSYFICKKGYFDGNTKENTTKKKATKKRKKRD